MLISRRGFLKLIGTAVAAGAVVPAMTVGRAPYVSAGEVVDYIGRAPDGFIGGLVVHNVGAWDGAGYPVQCWNNSYPRRAEGACYYDFDLANFRREVPPGFWTLPGSKKYPNVHTWVRVQRFGESLAEAVQRLNFATIRVSP